MTDASTLPSPDDPAAVEASAEHVHRAVGTVTPLLEVDLEPGRNVIGSFRG